MGGIDGGANARVDTFMLVVDRKLGTSVRTSTSYDMTVFDEGLKKFYMTCK